jgi:aryl-alcohol dehydrogenase (NADP+)
MDYVRLGTTGLQVSRICLGCMSFGDPGRGAHPWSLPEAQSRPFLEKALASGITFFDTANTYSDGSSEEIVGRAVNDFARREDVVLATKVFMPMRPGPNGGGLSRKAILHEIDASLERLGTDYVDLYQIHRWDPNSPIEETLEALDEVVRSGRARYLGASSMWAWQFSKALYTAGEHGWARFVSMQDQYNLLDREEEREMLPLCADQGIGVIPWLYGMDGDREIVSRVAEIAGTRDVSRAQVALAWVLANPVITAPIVGVTKDQHLDDALAAVDLRLTEEETTRLEEPYTPRTPGGFS